MIRLSYLCLILAVSEAGQLRDYVGVPHPAEANAALTATSGFAPWPDWDPYNVSTPGQPGNWPSAEQAGYYYIDPDHVAATDTANTYGYPDKPRATFPANGTYAAGTYMEFHGDYPDLGNDINYVFSGTSTNLCWITGTGTFRTTRLQIGGSSHLVIEGIGWGENNNATRPNLAHRAVNFANVLDAHTHHILLRNINCVNRGASDTSTGTVFFLSPHSGGGQTSYVVIDNITVNGVGAKNGVPEWDWAVTNPDTHAVSWTGGRNVNHIWVTNSTFAWCAGNGIQCNISNDGDLTADPRTASYHWIAGCVAHSNQQAGFWSKRGSDTIFSSNKSYNIYGPFDGGNNNGIGNQYGSDWLWFINNEIYSAAQGSKQSATANLGSDANSGKHFWIGNVYYGIDDAANESAGQGNKKGAGIDLWVGNSFNFIVCNTIYSANAGIRSDSGGRGDVYIFGNAIANLNDPEDPDNEGYAVGVENYYANDGRGHVHWNLGYTLAYLNGNIWDLHGGGAAQNTALFNTRARVSNNLESDPLFSNATTNPSTVNLMPKIDSPLVDVIGFDPRSISTSGVSYDTGGYTLPFDIGGVLDVWQAYEDRYGVPINVDRNGVTRPHGAGWDIGAYEYASSARLTTTTLTVGP